jgi:hypothetical protein
MVPSAGRECIGRGAALRVRRSAQPVASQVRAEAYERRVIGEFRSADRSYQPGRRTRGGSPLHSRDDTRATAVDALRPPPGPKSVVLDVRSPISRAAIAGLCERVRGILGLDGVDLVSCEVGGLVDPDPVAVDALARMQLTARRAGGAIRLRHVQARLRDLLAATGLCGALPRCGRQVVRPRWQAEEREQLRVDEEVDPADPAV